MKLWVVYYSHRHGGDGWPVFQDEMPTCQSLLRDYQFADVWEGEGRLDGEPPRDDEWIDISGPYYTPDDDRHIAPTPTPERMLSEPPDDNRHMALSPDLPIQDSEPDDEISEKSP